MKNATPLFRRPVLARLMAGLAVALTLGAPLAAQASPAKSVSIPAMMRSKVDLPDPFTPTTPIFTPGKKLSLIFSKHFLPPG